MRKAMAISSLLVALSAVRAGAQATEVYDNQMSSYDFTALKGGEWVETETITEYPGMTQPTLKTKIACIKVDTESAWMETWVADQVTCFQVSVRDRKILKAWTARAGEEGKEVTVKPAPEAAPAPEDHESTGTGKVSREKVTLGGKDFDCEKVDQDQVAKMSGMEIRWKVTTWYSEGYPFKAWIDPNAKPVETKDPIKWDGDKPSCKGGIVKVVSESNNGKTTTRICGIGTDAKPGLKIK